MNHMFKSFNILKVAIIIATVIAMGFVFSEYIINVDGAFDNFISSFRSENGINFWNKITFLGGKYFVSFLVVVVFFFLWGRSKVKIINLQVFLFSFFANVGTGWVLKNIVERDRPLGAELYEGFTYSFPSGHSIASFFIYGYLSFLAFNYLDIGRNKKYLITFFLSVLIIFIGFSRLYLGVHYLSDVLSAYLLGWFWLNFAFAFTRGEPREKKISSIRVE